MASVTIGFPVYNGASTIEKSLRCVLDGTYQDFEILVSDNCSTDATVSIVQSIAFRDQRVKLTQQPQNIGAVPNFRWLAEQATSPYFMWRAHDDLSDANYLEVLHRHLIVHEQAVLAVSNILTSKRTKEKHRPFSVPLKADETAYWKNLRHVHAAWVYGLFRTDFARKCVAYTDDEYGHMFGCDMIMLLHALLDGGVVGTNETTFNQRTLLPGRPEQQVDKQLRRKIVRDFYVAADGLAESYGIDGFERKIFRLRLWRYIFKRVVRWQKLI